MVYPPMCVAAMPVEAVIAGSMPHVRRYATYALTVCVLPLPGSPVKNTFAPVFKIASASACFIGTFYLQSSRAKTKGGLCELHLSLSCFHSGDDDNDERDEEVEAVENHENERPEAK